MTTETAIRFFWAMDDRRFKNIMAVVMTVVTALSSLVGYLDGDANARRAQANRDTHMYAQQAMGGQLAGYTQINYAQRVAYDTWLEWDTLAASAESQGDQADAARYRSLRDAVTRLSPLLSSTYFDAQDRMVNVPQFEADTYLVEATRLTEEYLSGYEVAQTWATKSGYYELHLTLLAVALFLFGLSLTIGGSKTRWLFAGVGSVVTLVAIVWACLIAARPVFDLRRQGNAIDAYARGMGLAHQYRWPEAVTAFDEAIAEVPDYERALFARGEAQSYLGNFQAAVADLEAALDVDDTATTTIGDLAYLRLAMGDFDEAIALNRRALAGAPDQLWLQFDLGISLLADGRIDEAEAEYAKGMAQAVQAVQAADAAGTVVSSTLWWSLESAAQDLRLLMEVIDEGRGYPPPERIEDPQTIRPVAEALVRQLRSLVLTLEYDRRAPQGVLTATVGPLSFRVFDIEATGMVTESLAATQFPSETGGLTVSFDYEGIQTRDRVIVKVDANGVEDPSLRTVATWDQPSSGTASLPIGVGDKNLPAFLPGLYDVEVYVGDHLAQTGQFTVVEK